MSPPSEDSRSIKFGGHTRVVVLLAFSPQHPVMCGGGAFDFKDDDALALVLDGGGGVVRAATCFVPGHPQALCC
jgi:hypothetical protein